MKKFLLLSALAFVASSCNYDTSDPHYTFGDMKSGQNEYNFKDVKDVGAQQKKMGNK